MVEEIVMKNDWAHIEQFRTRSGHMATSDGDLFGAFYLRIGVTDIIIVASNGSEEVPWEHVSLRARAPTGKERTPTWAEMCFVKDLFWDEEECVIQYHPPRSDYVNNHACVLHLWKPIGIEMPRPPSIAVGIK